MMENWIFPLTILPGIGLLIMSSTNWSVAITGEINQLLNDDQCNMTLLQKKIQQLGLVNRALVALYLCASLCALSGFMAGIMQYQMENTQLVATSLLCIGMIFLLIATVMLIIYAFRATNIKRQQFLDQLKK